MKYYYLIHINYLGFRFHGWQKQPNQKTVHLMVDKTVAFVLQHDNFKTLGCSRTDAMVSANHMAFELFLTEQLDMDWFGPLFDANLPTDIGCIRVEEVDQHFNIINTPRLKEYHYLFSFGQKPHPFSASLMVYFKGELDITLMQKGALLFEGEHNFVRYCTKPSAKTKFVRTIDHCRIAENTTYTASFFPKISYQLTIRSKGFLRYQVRLIMAQLIRLGRGEITLEDITESLKGEDQRHLNQIAPASGLILNSIDFEY